MPPTEWSSSLPSLQDLPLQPEEDSSLATYLETLSLACTSAANNRALDSLVETFYSPNIKSRLEATDVWISGPAAHTQLKQRTLTEAGVTIEPISASATIYEPNVVKESGKGRKGKWEGSRFATVYVMTRVVKAGGIMTESVTILHWERESEEDGGRWLMSGYEGMRGRASSFGFG